jgi:chromosome segregation ATPase
LQIQEHLRNELHTSKATARKLNDSEFLNSELKKQLAFKEEVLKSINEKQTKLHTTINGLTKTVDSMNHAVQKLFEIQKQKHNTFDGVTKTVHTTNHAVQKLFEKQTQLQTNIDGLTKRVELLNEMSQMLCELPKDVSTCKIEAVTVS